MSPVANGDCSRKETNVARIPVRLPACPHTFLLNVRNLLHWQRKCEALSIAALHWLHDGSLTSSIMLKCSPITVRTVPDIEQLRDSAEGKQLVCGCPVNRSDTSDAESSGNQTTQSSEQHGQKRVSVIKRICLCSLCCKIKLPSILPGEHLSGKRKT